MMYMQVIFAFLLYEFYYMIIIAYGIMFLLTYSVTQRRKGKLWK